MSKDFITKDSGARQDYSTGMRRDLQTGKPRFDLCIALDQKYDESLLGRWAELMGRGMEKYGQRNWELSSTMEEFQRFKASLCRHFQQFIQGETDEDHAAAICFNLNAMLRLMDKLNITANEQSTKESVKKDE
jgi:hypothetical protein